MRASRIFGKKNTINVNKKTLNFNTIPTLKSLLVSGFCGKNYDAAVLSAGHCGFGLGATPTALVNMQTVTKHYGPSHMAFIVIPLVGAFFIDIINAFIISAMMGLPIFN